MSIYKELSYDQEIDVVKGIQFSILGPDEIRSRSVVEVTKTDTFTGNEPVVGGLFDPRMGVLEHNRYCSTCEQKNIFCPGHFGHITLARPVFQPMFFDIVRKVLKCVCYRCSRPMISSRSNKADFANEIQRISQIKNPKKRWDAISKLSLNTKLKKCGDDSEDNDENSGCKARQPTRYLKEASMKITAEWKDAVETVQKEFSAEDILHIFQRITDVDMELMGFNPRWNKPEWLICTTLAVPPPSVRPSIIEENGQRREDDLTHKLSDIVKYNNQLRTRIESGKGTDENVRVLTNLIQYHIATFMDNQIPGLPVAQQRNGRKLKSIADRLKKKEGRIRGNLNGKRVDQSARSVITPDPYISLDELGVPVKIAMNVTFPEMVNAYNITEMRKLIINGPNTWPGAKYVRLSDGVTTTLKYADRDKIAADLKEGDIVDRHLRDGDYVLFNRQPSLHKMSMMSHKVRIMPYQTFRLNVLVTNPYNADFDGDEMNIFASQNVQTMSELMDLAAVPYMILAPRDGKPIVEVVQDTMVGAYRITKDWVTIHDKTMANLQMVNSYFDGKLPEAKHKNTHQYTGKQAYSQILPPGLFIEMKNKADEKFKIHNSEIISGTIDKTVYHALSRGMLPVIYHDYSPFEVRRFLDNTQRLICRWLMSAGFSVGISDLVTDKSTGDKLRQTIHEYKIKSYSKIEDVRKGKLENNSIFTNQDFFEREILNILNELTNQVGRIGLKQIDDKTNRMINMVKSGSKGKETNVAQMIACVGQQNVDGKRVAYGFTDRTLPHYTKYDDGPEARGFVENSFITGLSPQEVFFHAMGGREGLIDTAVKSVTGDTEIFIIEDGKPKTIEIGKWIDNYLDDPSNKSLIEYSQTANQELMNISKKTYIPTCDDKGIVTWGELTAVTRHDPTEKLYKVKTTGGREVIVADSESLLIWNSKTYEFKKMHSSKVQKGMFVPMTMNLAQPPVTIDEIDMIEYFPKNEYIHGTEFHKAHNLMKEAMKGRIQISRGWWEKNNGTTFTLPYSNKANLQRAVSGRCNLDNLKEGFIYPYHATRQHSLIPDKFKLDYENGQFIGLFLADGNAEIKSGQVTITKENEEIKSFAKKWFEKFSMKHAEKTEERKIGKITTVTGYSTYMALFMHKLVGHLCNNKYIPDIAFVAPYEFVRGIISGYFSGDGSVPKNSKSIQVCSTSKNIIDGMTMLLARIGIFAKVRSGQQNKNNLETKNILPLYTIDIRAQWARVFRDKIDLIVNYKNDRLKNINGEYEHRNYPYQNDVVLDTIADITLVDSTKYPKLYDVTVPSTLNFQTRMGWNLRDTSETGYIQRRLVKAMEDCKVYYDQTVRNATGAIVQYVYGEDGIDGTKIENQYISYIGMNLIDIDIKYNLRPEERLELYLTEDAMTQIREESSWINDYKEYYEKLLEDRQYLIHRVFRDEKIDKIQYPIPFDRIIRTALQRLNKVAPTAILTDLTPGYVLSAIKILISKLRMLEDNQGIRFLHVLLRLNLCPKVLIMEHHMSKAIFEWLINEIETRFIKALVHPGEMVGIIAAQSIGELGTQQSALSSSRVLITTAHGEHYKGPIGKFIDTLIQNNKNQVIDIGDDSCVLTLETGKNDFSIIGISENEKTSWNRILQVSRHPAKGGVMKVTTKSGKTTTATLSHSFLKRAEKGIVAVLGSNLTVGDRIPVARYIPEVTNPLKEVLIGNQTYTLNHEFGWICGAYLADGSLGSGTVAISKVEPIFEQRIRSFAEKYNSSVRVYTRFTENKHDYMTLDPNKKYMSKSTIITNMPLMKWIEATFGRGSYNKSVNGLVFASNKEFIAGILSGYFDGDGSINVSKQMIRAHSVNEGLIDDIILLLAYRGIFASKLKQDRKREKASLMWEVSVTKKYAPIFKSSIGLYTPHKADNLDKILSYLTKVTTQQDYIDMIPELGNILEFLGKRLELPGQSRIFAKFNRLGINRVGREALSKYIHTFENAALKDKYRNDTEISDAISILKQAANADAVYDEIVSIEYLPDPKEYVYDFTVPGNDSFMVDTGVLVHNTLDSFHSSGTAAAVKATSGVPRLKELLSVSKNIKTPSLLIFLKPDIGQVIAPTEKDDGSFEDIRIQESKEKCIKVMQQLEITRLIDILDSTEIYWDPPGDRGLQTGIQNDDGILQIYRTFAEIDENQCHSQSPWILRMQINKERLYRLGLTMMDIYVKLYSSYQQNIECIFSDDNASELIFRIRLTKNALKDVDPEDYISALKAMEHNIVNNILLKGLKGIKKVSMRSKNRHVYNSEKDNFEKIAEWMLDTDGTNLQDIFANPNIDQYRTRSNDIYEIYQTLGIEAARNALYIEFMEVVGEDAINYRHMSLLIDTMTNRGTLMSVDRHGINRGDVGPLAKSSFEETTDMLINASMFSEHDHINGVSANIMLGQLPPCGTGDHEIFLDEDAFIELMKDSNKLSKNKQYMRFNNPVNDSTYAEKEACAIENIAFNYTLPEKNTNIKAFPKQSVTFV
jgi:DNA-directed RNA polymerase beta' subunit